MASSEWRSQCTTDWAVSREQCPVSRARASPSPSMTNAAAAAACNYGLLLLLSRPSPAVSWPSQQRLLRGLIPQHTTTVHTHTVGRDPMKEILRTLLLLLLLLFALFSLTDIGILKKLRESQQLYSTTGPPTWSHQIVNIWSYRHWKIKSMLNNSEANKGGHLEILSVCALIVLNYNYYFKSEGRKERGSGWRWWFYIFIPSPPSDDVVVVVCSHSYWSDCSSVVCVHLYENLLHCLFFPRKLLLSFLLLLLLCSLTRCCCCCCCYCKHTRQCQSRRRRCCCLHRVVSANA